MISDCFHRRFFVSLMLSTACILVLAACGSSGSGGRVASQAPSTNPFVPVPGAKHGGNLVILRNEDSSGLDPTKATDSAAAWVIQNLEETLYTEAPNGLGVIPDLASGYTLSADKKTYTFTLRPGLEFSNGQPLTAADVVFSFQRCIANKAQGYGYLDAPISSISAAGPRTVVIKVSQPYGPLLATTALYCNAILPRNLDGESTASFFDHPVSSGPFVLKTWARGNQLVVVRNPHYWQPGKPYLNSITWKIVDDLNTQVLQLKGGEADAIAPPPQQVASLKATPGISVEVEPSTLIQYLLLNEQIKPLASVDVRRAIAMAAQRQQLVQSPAVLDGYGQAANSFISPSTPYHSTTTKQPAFNLAEARALIKKSGFKTPINIEFLNGSGDTVETTSSEILQAQLAPIGVDLHITNVDPGQIYSDILGGKYGGVSAYWTMDIADPNEISAELLDNATSGGNGYGTGFRDLALTKISREAAASNDPARRARLYQILQDAQASLAPQIPLYYAPFITAYRSTVHDLQTYPSGHPHLENTWMTGSGSS